MCAQLRTIYNLILHLESTQESLYKAALEEHTAIMRFDKKHMKLAQNGKFSVTLGQENESQERVIKFTHIINLTKHQVKQISYKYRQFVQKYLKLLASSSDQNLQLLSVRLNFNDYYTIA